MKDNVIQFRKLPAIRYMIDVDPEKNDSFYTISRLSPELMSVGIICNSFDQAKILKQLADQEIIAGYPAYLKGRNPYQWNDYYKPDMKKS